MNKRLALILCLAFVARMVAIWYFGFERITFGDAADYLATTSSMCETGTYPEGGSVPFFRAPGLPVFILLTTLCHTEQVVSTKIALAVIDCLEIGLIYGLAMLLWKRETIALKAALLAAIYPVFLFQVTDLRTEPLFMFFLTGCLLFFMQGLVGNWARSFVLAGICLGLAALTRPVALVLIVLFCLAILFWRSIGHRKRWMHAALMAIAFLGILFPWIVLNYGKYGEVILVNDAGGCNFWRGSSPKMHAIYHIKDRTEFTQAALQFERETSPQLAAEIATRSNSPLGRGREWYKAGIENIRSSPEDYLAFLLEKAILYWRAWLNPQVYPLKIVLFSALVILPLYLLGAVGLFSLYGRNRPLFVLCVSYLALSWIAEDVH